MGFKEEFKEFALKGNVLDMAIGIIIGAEFGKIVNSMVNDVIMPPIGYVIGGVTFTDLKLTLKPADAANNVAEVAVKYGSFIQNCFNFLIIALAIFMMIKVINKLRPETVKEKTS
ncbi:MAG: large-conductance mechanosensitive channel protein MscL [Chitinophagales bacterium]